MLVALSTVWNKSSDHIGRCFDKGYVIHESFAMNKLLILKIVLNEFFEIIKNC